MQVMKWSVIALAVAAGTTQMAVASSQSESKGFVEDSSFDVFNRALYFNRDFRSKANGASTSANPAGYREETGLGIRLLYESGFTQGTVGFGVDAHSLSSIKIDSGRGRYGTGQFAQTDSGRADDTQTEVGGAVKFRVSDTVLKYGNQFTGSPVFATDDSRILPEVATGTLLTSNEIEGLELSAGRFTALSSQEQTSRDSVGLTSANIIGASYQFTDNFSGALHASDIEDHWKKKYVNLNYNIPLAEEQALNFDFHYYKTDDTGKELSGEVQNKLWSLEAAYSMGAHTFILAHQRSSGDTAYIYGVDGSGTIFTANAATTEFWDKDERSWKVGYKLDMTDYGVPGLSFATHYIKGYNIDATSRGFNDEGKEHDFRLQAQYVVQEGAAKDLSIMIRNNIVRTNDAASGAPSGVGGDINEVRVFIDYPLSIL